MRTFIVAGVARRCIEHGPKTIALRGMWQPRRNELGIEYGVPQIGTVTLFPRQRPIGGWLPRIEERRAPELRF
jgi:hypothetical protein